MAIRRNRGGNGSEWRKVDAAGFPVPVDPEDANQAERGLEFLRVGESRRRREAPSPRSGPRQSLAAQGGQGWTTVPTLISSGKFLILSSVVGRT